jgi:DNA polymerase-3 subunit beta
MKFEIARRDLLRPIQLVTGVVEKRQTLPILSNVRIGVKGDDLTVSGTDLEIELVARVKLATPAAEDGETTVPARKLADLWRSLPEDAVVTVSAEGERATIRSGRTKFLLATKSADEYPSLDSTDDAPEIFVPRTEVAGLIARTGFSMAQHDEVSIRIGSSSLQLATSSFRLSTKLIDGRFPDYEKVIPPRGSREIIGGRDALRQAFGRAAILSNEKYRGVRLTIGEGSLTVHANNPEQEEAEEVVELETSGEPIEISFNVSYLQDALGAMQGDMVRLSLTDANSSARLEAPGDDSATYVVMPMRL